MARRVLFWNQSGFDSHLTALEKALAAFGAERPITPLDSAGALGDAEAEAASDSLWASIRKTRQTAATASRKLRELKGKYAPRGRPPEIARAFTDRMKRAWVELTAASPTVTHDPIRDVRTGPFVDFVEAARKTLKQAHLQAHLGTAAEQSVRSGAPRGHRNRKKSADEPL